MALNDKKIRLESQFGGLGLSCTPEGVSLAGVPLLRETIAGLAPRPMVEFALLMKSAYGHDLDPIRPYPGLDVIAKALNQGDIGRAMVAAIQLKLPDLDEDGAAYIVRADEALKKYDPSEPRDERGRWTGDGGSPSTHSAKPSTRSVRSTKPAHSVKPTRHSSSAGSPGDRPVVSNVVGFGTGIPIESLAVIMGLSRACVNNAREPRYFEKTQMCSNVSTQCSWLADANAHEPLRRDACLWPDGAAAIMKLGIMVPFRVGHPF